MELSDLNVFRTVVAAGGITRAAEQLIACSPTSRRACASSRRSSASSCSSAQGKKLSLSPAGRILLDYADRLLALPPRRATPCRIQRRAAVPPGLDGEHGLRAPAGRLSEYRCRYP